MAFAEDRVTCHRYVLLIQNSINARYRLDQIFYSYLNVFSKDDNDNSNAVQETYKDIFISTDNQKSRENLENTLRKYVQRDAI